MNMISRSTSNNCPPRAYSLRCSSGNAAAVVVEDWAHAAGMLACPHLEVRRSGMGHEDAFALPRLSARYRFSQGTFAGTRGNGQDAPCPPFRRSSVATAPEAVPGRWQWSAPAGAAKPDAEQRGERH